MTRPRGRFGRSVSRPDSANADPTDATFIDRATNRSERVFPRGTDWLTFRSQLPGRDVFANSVLDPAIGIGGELGLRAFATADWRNWTSAIKIGLFELSTRVGLPSLENQSLNQGLAVAFDTLELSADAFRHSDNAAEIVPELIQNAGMQVVMMVLQIAGASNPITFVVTQVIQIATCRSGSPDPPVRAVPRPDPTRAADRGEVHHQPVGQVPNGRVWRRRRRQQQHARQVSRCSGRPARICCGVSGSTS